MELEFSSDERLSGTERNGEARGHLRKNGGGLHEDERLPDSGIPSKADIDLSGTEQTGSVIPEFSGVLDGENHKITGLKAPLFGQLSGTVSNVAH